MKHEPNSLPRRAARPALLRRRDLLAAGAATVALPVGAQPRGGTRTAVVGQLFDASAAQQDVSKDFLVGSRVAWQELRGNLRGRPVQHLAIEVDGSAAGVRQTCRRLLEDPGCVALCGTVGDIVARQAVQHLRQEAAAIAHAAPWLQDSGLAIDERTFPIFAGRQEQIAHALKSLSVMGVREAGAVFASAREAELYQRELAESAAALRLKLSTWRAQGDLTQLGQRLGADSPPLLLFVGGTPELVQFTQGLQRQARQRYVLALADVNLQTLLQMGAARATPVIATQAVPLLGAPLPVVRRYREALARLFDEPPTALGLAGYLAARYTIEVLNAVDGPLTRPSVLAAFQRRAPLDLGGFQVRFDDGGRSAAFVTQSMLTADGRIIG